MAQEEFEARTHTHTEYDTLKSANAKRTTDVII